MTIREKAHIGSHTSLGTLSDVQGDCHIGNYVHLHSNVHIGMKTTLKDYVWIFPYVVFTNDPTPPSEVLLGATAEEFAVVCTGTVVLPGVHIGQDELVGAGTNLTKDVPDESIVVGNPGKVIGNVKKFITAREIRSIRGDIPLSWACRGKTVITRAISNRCRKRTSRSVNIENDAISIGRATETHGRAKM